MKTNRLPKPSVLRLCTYLRELTRLDNKRVENIRSRELAGHVGVSPDQIRRDLWLIGSFGKRGQGYSVKKLRHSIAAAIGLERDWPFVLVGVGNLGTAVLNYRTLERRGFKVVAAFDSDPARIGKKAGKLVVQDVRSMPRNRSAKKRLLAVLTVPGSAAQETADKLVKLGVKGILNLAPAEIFVPRGVSVRNADMSREMEALAVSVKLAEIAR